MPRTALQIQEDIQARIYEETLNRLLARNKLSNFIRKVFGTVDPGAVYTHNWHIDYICEYLEAVYLGQIRHIVFNMPPRHLKTMIVTIGFPAWVLGKQPTEQFICASYSGDLAKKHSIDCRRVIESEWYRILFPDTILAGDQNEKKRFKTTQQGQRVATSVGGTATGDGGNYKILDDPMNPKEAVSDTERLNTLDWLDQTWSTRENNPATVRDILVMQRIHIDDPAGHFLKTGLYEHVKIPQQPEKKTTITFPRSKKKVVREKDEFLDKRRFAEDEKIKAQKALGSYGYAGQQQQEPTPLEGGRIELGWFPRYRVMPVKFDMVGISIDTAQKDKEINDPSAFSVYGKLKSRWCVLDIITERLKYPQLKKKTLSLINKWHPDFILIEDKSTGSSLIQELEGKPVIPIEPEADKVTRMDTQTPSIEAGMIMLPDPEHLDRPWLFDFEQRLIHFPNPASWDELDTLSQFLKWVKTQESKIEVW